MYVCMYVWEGQGQENALRTAPVSVNVVQVHVRDLRGGLVEQLHALAGQRLGLVRGRGRPVAGRVHCRLQLRVHEGRLQQILPLVEGALHTPPNTSAGQAQGEGRLR